MIRHAAERDIRPCAERGEQIHYDSSCWIPYDPQSVEETLRELVASPDGVVIVDEQDGEIYGLIAGRISCLPTNRKYRQASEVFRWAATEPNGNNSSQELLDAFEDWADEKEACSILLSSVESELLGITERRLIWRSTYYVAASRNG